MSTKFKVGDKVAVVTDYLQGCVGTVEVVHGDGDMYSVRFTPSQRDGFYEYELEFYDTGYTEPKCDCGAVKTDQPGHSTWCKTMQKNEVATLLPINLDITYLISQGNVVIGNGFIPRKP